MDKEVEKLFENFDEGNESKNHTKSWVRRTCRNCLDIFYADPKKDEKLCKTCRLEENDT